MRKPMTDEQLKDLSDNIAGIEEVIEELRAARRVVEAAKLTVALFEHDKNCDCGMCQALRAGGYITEGETR